MWIAFCLLAPNRFRFTRFATFSKDTAPPFLLEAILLWVRKNSNAPFGSLKQFKNVKRIVSQHVIQLVSGRQTVLWQMVGARTLTDRRVHTNYLVKPVVPIQFRRALPLLEARSGFECFVRTDVCQGTEHPNHRFPDKTLEEGVCTYSPFGDVLDVL